ncbi:MAG: molybdenum cofactor biosysynthesis protein [Verrucomicrobia bacterium]|nr:molybdenum cofactor biosysynthesis protein [Verrucomicrobiota bacterium]MCH8514363.1 molybdenum cofactor biosysynthesis protein [Kiritimatiellia bacterium]
MIVNVEHLLISPEHIYRGHFGGLPGKTPCLSPSEIELRAGRGIVGDRYFDFKENFKGQITFFDLAVLDALATTMHVNIAPDAVRRNVLLRGVDLNGLIGKTFVLQGIRFQGAEECKPCFWMDEAVAPGSEAFLKGRGGLRARILTDGVLRTGTSELIVEESA